jgi:hypothetical protein
MQHQLTVTVGEISRKHRDVKKYFAVGIIPVIAKGELVNCFLQL